MKAKRGAADRTEAGLKRGSCQAKRRLPNENRPGIAVLIGDSCFGKARVLCRMAGDTEYIDKKE